MKNKIREIILNCEKMERRFALLCEGKLEEYKLERDNNNPEAGDIFLGKIINLDQSLQAAFVDIGAGKNAKKFFISSTLYDTGKFRTYRTVSVGTARTSGKHLRKKEKEKTCRRKVVTRTFPA